MRHPFESIPPGRLRVAFVPALALYIIIQLAFAWLDAPLRTAAAPNGIISFELAGSLAAAQAILASWGPAAQLDASFGLGIDFLFMAAYSTMIGVAAIWAGRALAARGWPFARQAGIIAWGLWVAVICDSIENFMLLVQLFNGAASPLPEIAAVCAALKFALIVVGLAYAAAGAAAWITRSAPGTRFTSA